MFQSYANPHRIRYQTAGIIQFGAAGETVSYTFTGPKGKKGLVKDIEVTVTETMVGTTEVPEITVGAAASTNNGTTKVVSATYGRFRLGTTAAAGYATTVGSIRARPLVTGNGAQQTLEDFTGHVKLETDFIPVDTEFVITLLEGLDGTEAGAGIVAVEIDWF